MIAPAHARNGVEAGHGLPVRHSAHPTRRPSRRPRPACRGESVTETIAVKADRLYKAFGRRPHEVVKKMKAGSSRDEVSSLGTAAVIDASFEVHRGEIFVVMGLSGSGKSTLIRMLNGLLDATSGTVTVAGQPITGIPAAQLRDVRRKNISMVFQHFALLPHRSVIDNVAYGLEVQGMGREERLAKARTIIRLVGLDGWADSLPSELSGGMQQRVGLGRALAADTDVLLMDEAFSALDPLIRREMQEQLIELQAELGKTIIFITHDLNEAMFLGDRIAVMRDGRIVQIGTPEEILTDPANDYVAQFVQDVDRARVLTAASVMEPVRAVVTTTGGPRAALRIMRDFQTSAAFVLNRDGSFAGVVRDRDVLKLVKAGDADLRSIILGDAVSVSPDAPLVELVEPSVESDLAIAVVDEKKRLLGVIPRVTLLAALGNVSTNTGDLPVIEPAATISVSMITETLRETALEGAAL
ncbi:glycine betaine/L-proline ABC transporter ATP-binding protein [Cryobacterium sp. TMT1-21]|uniref:Glycine betaine/L-proline ABC transporter ATP-binding protein n=1 Tax=Cryobacterium shii TaxID=1259235 RepID=A0AAQ2HE42_9MICO|nr:glycine betaine/L-proline ABC transporter ATP-binding protein [Cryobacterium shii]TFC88748.1 glycine betaine/L-proline ABC transporter ATP-binding protein [Cryobacterium sp. TmT2-59]TFD12328.1 glycine betaine/L-proline ABC transporter ATP-binding protein [Cryobacterium sp. TMT1-21]